ncbi:MAG: hypothetical protein M1582_01620 [Actinobacteria bacterium]|nr:hypothetical protein [Actinomycetota bacterium]
MTVRPDIRDAIRDYLRRQSDPAYYQSVFAMGDVDSVLSALEGMVREGNLDDLRDAIGFNEDAIHHWGPKGCLYAYYRSGLLRAFRDAIYAQDFRIRHNAIVVLGELGPASNARILSSALPWFLAHDPLNLDELLLEITRLLPPRQWRRVRKAVLGSMVASPFYLTRWAAVEILWARDCSHGRAASERERGFSPGWVRQYLRRLAWDRHPWVRAEAGFRLEPFLASKWAGLNPLAGDVDFHSRFLKEPVPTFFAVWLGIFSYLSASSEADYDAALVEAVARHLSRYPIAPRYDPQLYWSELSALRAATA